jgi:predicted metal-dependent HD superfamily phosphohydrolase
MIPARDDWSRFCSSLGIADPKQYDILKACYSQVDRFYHNFEHIGACLAELNAVRSDCQDVLAVECALWFHDVVYDSKAKDNEAQSAVRALKWLQSVKAGAEFSRNVESLIMETRHAVAPATVDAQIIVDVDLSILGQCDSVFDEYERNIRKEYAWVPDDQFRAGRKSVLEGFLKRASIYSTEYFKNKYEVRARKNLERSIARIA